MRNLRELCLDGTALKELPSSIQHLQGLQYLDLENCKNLVNIPDNICNLRSLKTLIVSGCSKLNKLPENLGSLTHLQLLYAARLDSMSCQLPSLSDLRFLRILNLDRSNLVHGAIRSDISTLYSLEEVDLSYCNLAEGGIPSEICYLSSLQALYLKGNHFSSIPSGISQLLKLKILDLSHCEMLQQIPELPSSLQILDAHGCIRLESLSSPQSPLWSSLFKCFKSEIKELECRMASPSLFLQGFVYRGVNIVIPESSGIPEGTFHEGSHVTLKLPWNWYRDYNFLGFALWSAYSPLDNESKDGDGDEYPCTFKCVLNYHGFLTELPLKSRCTCYNDGGVSDQVWAMYCPKGAIARHRFLGNSSSLSASFQGYIHGRAAKVKKCAVHLLYRQGSSALLEKRALMMLFKRQEKYKIFKCHL
ncbi:hypothetical protein PVL29_024860 [Vitis rotundifolia]|nr:hypothetical protein PVL29_024860 [Vitis rotundifolia]